MSKLALRTQYRVPTITTNQVIHHQFRQYDLRYDIAKAMRDPQLVAMEETLNDFEKQGKEMIISRQFYFRAKWWEEYTAHFERFDRLKHIFVESLKDTDQPEKLEQAEDGSWGRFLKLYFLKFDQTVDAINELSEGTESPKYPLTFMQRLNDPTVRDRYLKQLLVSDISETGVNNRDALNAMGSGLAQFCFKPNLRNYIRDYTQGFNLTDEYVASYKQFVDWWQDETTGYWGAWYKTDFGIVHTTDLSITYHMIAYMRKDKSLTIQHWPQIIKTTFEIRNKPYPYGWLHEGHMNDHNNYDVAKIFKYGWKYMTEGQRTQASEAIQEMLDYCLNVSWNDQEGFVGDPTFYNSLSSAYYFAVSFLCVIGYFNKDARFWTDQDFPESEEFRKKILFKMDELDMDDRIAEAAREQLLAC
ncbi:hypothetical protein [Salidesulfovibrio onnuriiensis]|uniref:hypothetical protein n=1 Tax=Salidesulfovibrio onnuriiensis TaxID=2583823 RepID=UPI0011C78A40|nr:hypothetical protein [Salidesulfovibrio onnuriiensis]